MKKTITVLCLLALIGCPALASFTNSFKVAKDDIQAGFVVKKVWLSHYAEPVVHLQDITYRSGIILPVEAVPSDPQSFTIKLGKNRKRPFALVYVPAYNSDPGTKEIRELSGFSMTVDEKESQEEGFVYKNKAAKATATSSVLANGNWYKVSVPNTGLFKITRSLVQAMGVNPDGVNMANLRVFGNGGNMLSENNAIPRLNDLVENAIWVNDDGNPGFGENDYAVFYATGPVKWTKDEGSGTFVHQINIYEDKAYYFINFDQLGLRINTQNSAGIGNVNVNAFNDYSLHEQELINLGKFGKEWWGEEYSDQPGKSRNGTFTFNLGNLVDSAKIRFDIGARASGVGSTFNLNVNGHSQTSIPFTVAGTDDNADQISEKITDIGLAASGQTNLTANLTFQPSTTDARGFLNYIEINTRRYLSFGGTQLLFRDLRSVGAGNIAAYSIGNASGNTQVWDVTNPQVPARMSGSLSGSTYTFTQSAESLHEFAAVNGGDLPVPTFVSNVPNQNLHGAEQVKFLIVSHPAFLEAANAVADFHRQHDNMSVLVTTTTQVYNEFSSGGQDLSAIRDFARMLYDRAGTDTSLMPQYLLLMGDASYDYKDRVANNSNYVPTYQTDESHFMMLSFCNDEFFGFLDDNENISSTDIVNTVDMGVGRMPISSEADAMIMVNKLKSYKAKTSLGPWRLSGMVVADDEDGAGPHMDDAEIMAKTIQDTTGGLYNFTRVYLNNLPIVSTPSGQRCPQANAIINNQVYKGCFFINYSGHGNTTVWTAERILTFDDLNRWQNIEQLPFMVTATCDFGRFDQPDFVSGAERAVIKADGGVIAMLTTTQLVYQYSNRILNKAFVGAQYARQKHGWLSFGDAFRISKNGTYETMPDQGMLVNFRKFSLLGDPALLPNFPRYKMAVDSIVDAIQRQRTDTIKALGTYVVNGSVRDDDGNIMDGLNGKLSVVIYDKPRTTNVVTYYGAKSFNTQDNIIYKGKATVTAGRYSYTFIAPKDINYDFGNGKISSYAENGILDAAGAEAGYIVGGYSDNPPIDNDPPIVKVYIGDSLFKDGGITGANTLLYAALADETGINVSGNSVGHDLTAILDDQIQTPYVLNDYYETDDNTYKRGKVYFPIYNLAVGKHKIKIKAWDVNNNSGEGVVNFEVVDGNQVKVQDLFNYPNPFSDVTHFFFQHNHPNEDLTVEINIYTTTGLLVKSLQQMFVATNSRSNDVTWDGTDNNGAKLPSAMYVYRAKMSTKSGIETTAYQKAILMR